MSSFTSMVPLGDDILSQPYTLVLALCIVGGFTAFVVVATLLASLICCCLFKKNDKHKSNSAAPRITAIPGPVLALSGASVMPEDFAECGLEQNCFDENTAKQSENCEAVKYNERML